MTYDFNKVTVADMRKLMASQMANDEIIDFADRVIVGGVLHLPFAEWPNVVRDLFAEFHVWVLSLQEDKVTLSDLLKDVKGL